MCLMWVYVEGRGRQAGVAQGGTGGRTLYARLKQAAIDMLVQIAALQVCASCFYESIGVCHWFG